MNRLKIIMSVGIISFFVVTEAFAIPLFDGKYKETLKKLEDLTASYEKLGSEKQGLEAKVENLAKESEALARENEVLRQDRDNLMAKAKSLMVDTGKLKEGEERIAKFEMEKSTLSETIDKLHKQNSTLQDKIKELQSMYSDASKERDKFKRAFEKSGKDDITKNLRKDLSDLQKTKNRIGVQLARREKEIKAATAKERKLESEKKRLTEKLNEYKKNYSEALAKNRAFEAELKHMPKKFSELARQNKILLKQTAQMHYNMGVNYCRDNDFVRARIEFEKAIEINPEDASAHFNLGYIYAEYLVDRRKAIEQFRHYLRLAKEGDKDMDWAKKYILTWQTWEGKEAM